MNAKRIDCKWVFNSKRDSKGNIEWHKARLVTRDFTQQGGIDYTEIFSTISKRDSFIIIMAIVSHYDLELRQMNVKTIFLNKNLDKEVHWTNPKAPLLREKNNLCVN